MLPLIHSTDAVLLKILVHIIKEANEIIRENVSPSTSIVGKMSGRLGRIV
jgi:hypothetical protein